MRCVLRCPAMSGSGTGGSATDWPDSSTKADRGVVPSLCAAVEPRRQPALLDPTTTWSFTMVATLTTRPLRTIWVTCSRDGRSHQVTDEETAAGLHARTGRYVALCGHAVIAGPMLESAGSPCRRCPLPMDGHGSRLGQHRRPGLITRLRGREQPLRTPAVPPVRLPAPSPGWDSRTPAVAGLGSTPVSSGPATLPPIVGTAGGIW